MRQRLNFWVIGGDPRQATLANALADDGHTVHTYALDQGAELALAAQTLDSIPAADCVILPLPALDGDNVNAPLSSHPLPLAELMAALRPGQLLCAGMASPALTKAAEAAGLHLVDYFAREELAVANAVPGALAVWPWETRDQRGHFLSGGRAFYVSLRNTVFVRDPTVRGVLQMSLIPPPPQLREQIELGLLHEAYRQGILTEEQLLRLSQARRKRRAAEPPAQAPGSLPIPAERMD